MKTRLLALIVLVSFLAVPARAQVAMSAGSYTQNFNSLATSGTGNSWMDNTTLPGWYAAKTAGGTTVTEYRAGTGESNAGALYSFGVAGVNSVNDRALGTIASGTPGNFAFGVRFLNDTGITQTNIRVAYTGEQWRNGGNVSAHALAFTYRVSSVPITDADAVNASAGWTFFPALTFVTPTVGTTAGALDGNAAGNQQGFVDVFLSGVSVPAGHELFLRWLDINDLGNDHGITVDELTVSFGNEELSPPVIVVPPEDQTAAVGDLVTFTVVAAGAQPLNYQWQFNTTDIPSATNATFTLAYVTTNDAGSYRVVVTNQLGSTNSPPATLTVNPLPSGVSLLTYNVRGFGATDWSTNSLQLQAIARQLQYLEPDVITFNEIPFDLRHEMTNFVAGFLPGYSVAISTGTDGALCSAIASRYPITRASKWLDGIDLRGFGYSNANNSLDNFTRDLFEAEVAVPGFARPLHVFTTHLKATASADEYADNAAKRAAEAAAITNFLATNIHTLYPYDLYALTGDMNDSDTNVLAIQKLISPATGLVLTNPRNPVTSSLNTYSTEFANPNSRLDYIFPNQLLAANIRTSLVFRTDRLSPVPLNLNSNDCKVASDHLPVLMVFNNPYDKPFQLLEITRTNPTVTLRWESVPGQPYQVEASTNLTAWSVLADNLVATGVNYTFRTNLSTDLRFFRVRRLP